MDKYIIKRSEIESMPGQTKPHYLNNDAVRNTKSLGDLTGITGFGFHIVEVPAGKDSTEFHVHYHEDECLYVLSGTAMAYIGDDSFCVSEGDFIGYRATGLPHKIHNASEAIFRCIVVGQRCDHDVADYPKLGKRLYRNKGQAWDLVNTDEIDHP